MSQPSRTALITGASSGIGKVLAATFVANGWNLAMAPRGVEKMEALAGELRQRNGIFVTVIRANLEIAGGAEQLHADVKQRGIVIGALINNAGCGACGPFRDSDLVSDQAMMQRNMISVMTLCKLFMPDLLAAGGKLMNVASTAAFQPGPHMAVYFATKAFVLSFSEAPASELEETGVTVTALCPGPTASDFWSGNAMRGAGLAQGKNFRAPSPWRVRPTPR
jgi:short-subunit dehydrogenase